MVADAAVVGGIDPVSFRRLQKDLKRLEPEVRKAFNREMKTLAGGIATDAKRNASWSTRIPSSIRVSATSTRVGVRAKRTLAPHARPYEGFGRGDSRRSSFRHKVFGNPGVWVSEPTRPFMAPAARAHQKEFEKDAKVAVTKAARSAGWTK